MEELTILDGYIYFLLGGALLSALLFVIVHIKNKPFAFAAAALVLGAVIGAALSKGMFMICKMTYTLSEGFVGTLTDMHPNRFSFFGGALGACLGAVIAGKTSGLTMGESLDLFAPWGVLTAAVARAGEFMLGTYGCGRYFDPEESPFLCRLPFCLPVNYGDDYTEYYLAVFIMEALFAFAVFLVSVLYFRKKPHCFARSVFFLCLGQILFQSLLTENYVWHEFVKVEQLFSMLVIEGVLLWHWLRSGKKRGTGLPPLLALLAAGIFVACEFFLDKPIPFTDYYELPHLATYGIMLLGMLLLAWCEHRAYKKHVA